MSSLDDLPPEPVDETRVELMIETGGDALGDHVLLAEWASRGMTPGSLEPGSPHAERPSLRQQLQDLAVDVVYSAADLIDVVVV